jgi:acetyl esterase/lipase
MNAGVRLVMRRRDWGDEAHLVRRARRLFGMPPMLRALWSRGAGIVPVAGPIPGEWIVPPNAESGAILFFHGGGYVAGSPADHRPMTVGLARRTGRRVFAPDYRLAPEHRFPAALDDACASYRWLLDLGIDPTTIVLAGDSAGGGLVLATLVRVREASLPLPARAVCFSPWADLSASTSSVRHMDGRCHMFRTENIAAFASAYLGGASPLDPAASPLYADLGGLPPILIQVGSTELLVDESRGVHEKILAHGGASRLEVYTDLVHVWQMLDGVVPEATAALDEAAAFLVGTCVAAA